ncbi:hypothetical protein DPMN_095916 [Dreissena polymorpha]|uniref:C2H2-type domain-containing protein n=1 Tax=Dreissena polymorpha TaxID=45954 RepID=A0A9D4R412_DREPO|nr:hypothetical protein DPMN_095916 [Dreissena polymorpha]
MPTILKGFKERRTQMSRVCTVRQELCGQVPTRGSREKCKKEGLVKCYQCGLAVRSENDLKEHVKTNMPDKCYRCEECFKPYKHKTNLSRHLMTSHKSVNTD